MPKDPFTEVKLDELDEFIIKERAAARRMGLDELEPTLDVPLTPSDQPLKKAEPWLRRDYSRWENAWYQIATAPKDEVGVEYQTEQDARNARTEFYKARAALKQSQAKDIDLPSNVAQLFEWSINLRKAGTVLNPGRWWLVFRKIGTEIDVQYELPNFD